MNALSATGHAPASLGRRIIAVIIDGAVFGAVLAVASGATVAISVLTAGSVSPAVLLVVLPVAALAWFLVQTAMQGAAGSLGMRAMGLRLAHTGDDADLGFGRALGRAVVWALSCSVIVGYFSPLFDPGRWRRGWHDLAVSAVMTDAGAQAARRVPSLVTAAEPAHVPTPEPVSAAVSAPAPEPAPAPAAVAVPRREPVLAAAAVTPTGPEPRRVAASDPAPQAIPPTPEPAPGEPAPRPRPAWAPAQPGPGRAARTLPVDVISTVPGAPHRDGRPAGAESLAPPAVAILRWDDGTRHTVYEGTLFGRGPSAQPGLRTVPVRDETLSISKTHFEIGADADGTWIVDRHSLNGVVVSRDGVPQRLAPGIRARIWSGDVLDVGDRRVTVEIAR